jgi:acyl carrier protein
MGLRTVRVCCRCAPSANARPRRPARGGLRPAPAPRHPTAFSLHPMTTDIHQTLGQVFREVFDDGGLPDDISALDRDAMESWDSLGHIRLVTALEEAFSVTFTLEEIESMTSVPAIAGILSAKS